MSAPTGSAAKYHDRATNAYFRPNTEPTTVYVSEKDFWIGLSEFLHLRSRVRSFWNPSVYLRALLTSVDSSAMASGRHSVVFLPAVNYDLFFVDEQELPPERLPGVWNIKLMWWD